jgi:lipoyl(octanoyl) transferase
MKKRWLYSIEPGCEGETNMARDVEMARLSALDRIPRLRLYSWMPYTLSLGHNQSEEEFDARRVEEHGYAMVRRPTGGRAVLHAEEITYAVAMPSEGEGVQTTYARISEGLKRGLELLGATDLSFTRSQPDFREHYTDEESSGCFSASALSELEWRGRKLAGSAQRRFGDILLQHGSLLTGPAHLDIVSLYAGRSPDSRLRLKERLAARTASLDQILFPLPSFEALALALRDGLAAEFGVEMEEGEMVCRT